MSATVQEIQDAIIAKLTSALPELSVEAFPEKPEEYELLHPLGAVLVQYDGSAYSANRIGNGGVSQVRTLRFSVVYLVRNLRDAAGCYDVLARGAEALVGLAIPGTVGAGTIVSESFNAETDGVWMYLQSYEFKAHQVATNHA